MAIESGKNLYRGVNPHLQSMLQTPGTPDSPSMFSSFHSHYVVHIADFLNAHLPRQYVARAEQSLQIFSQSSLGAFVHSQPRKPDVSVYRRPESTGPTAVTASTPAATWTWEGVVIETVEIVPEDQMMAVVIHRLEEHQRLGKPVTQLELLSPANKPGGRHSEAYRKKRLQLLVLFHRTDLDFPGRPTMV